MNFHIALEEEKIHCTCKGRLKGSFELFKLKQAIFLEIQNNPSIRSLSFSLDTFPIDLNFLGFLLLLSKTHSVQIFITHYSSFRMLEDLFLLKKFNVKYERK